MVRVDLTKMLNSSIVPATGNVCDSDFLPPWSRSYRCVTLLKAPQDRLSLCVRRRRLGTRTGQPLPSGSLKEKKVP
jgi:hypothetical protein